MMMNGKNECIHCTINNCVHHDQDSNYCTLEEIQVGTHENNPTQKECVDCESFKNKADVCGCR